MQHRRAWTTLATIGILVAVLAACGGSSDSTDDSGGNGGSGGDCADPTFTNLTGVWSVQNDVTGYCAETVEQFEIYMEQDGAELRIIGQISFTTTICGSRAAADRPLSYLRDGGVMTVNNLVLSFSSDTRFTGTAQWTWTKDTASCSGNMSLQGGR